MGDFDSTFSYHRRTSEMSNLSDLDLLGVFDNNDDQELGTPIDFGHVASDIQSPVMTNVSSGPLVPFAPTNVDIRQRQTSSQSSHSSGYTSSTGTPYDMRHRTISEESAVRTPDQVSSPGSYNSMSPNAYVTLTEMSPASTVSDVARYTPVSRGSYTSMSPNVSDVTIYNQTSPESYTTMSPPGAAPNVGSELVIYDAKPMCTGQTPVFLTKLWQMVEKGLPVAQWGDGEGTIIINQRETDYLFQYFKTNKISSFIRQLNMYGFNKISTNGDLLCFRNEHFVQGQPDLMQHIKRNGPGKQKCDSRPRKAKTATNAKLSDRLDKVEDELDQVRDKFGKMMSDVVHVIMAARPGNYQPPITDLADRSNRKRQSGTAYPAITPGRSQRDPGKLPRELMNIKNSQEPNFPSPRNF